jgi:1,4-dihydroxy-2-naphthoyl-CoA hydrolase
MDLAELTRAMPYAESNGIVLTHAEPDEVRGRLDWAPERCTVGGTLHGGAIMTLADSVGAVCAFLGLPEGAGTATLSSATNLLRAVREGYVEAVARPLHRGRTTVVVVTEVRDGAGKLVAQTTQTQAVLL